MSVNTLLNGILDINVKSVDTTRLISNGDLSVIPNGNLYINGTTTFSGNNHIGRVMIPSLGTVSNIETVANMNNDAVILITSRNSVDSLWVVPIDGSFTVQTATPAGADIHVDYFILKVD